MLSKCGAPADDEALFCEKCGTAHGGEAVAATRSERRRSPPFPDKLAVEILLRRSEEQRPSSQIRLESALCGRLMALLIKNLPSG
ncbi:MAG: zinc ribbon domain-containing protein [Clostridia bacterium]|nr:zinc ribbon domain-containing protein [Clostridia bacterium]